MLSGESGSRHARLSVANVEACIESMAKLHPLDTESARRRQAGPRAADTEHRTLCRHRETCWRESSSRRPRRERELRRCCRAPRGSSGGIEGATSLASPLSRSPRIGAQLRARWPRWYITELRSQAARAARERSERERRGDASGARQLQRLVGQRARDSPGRL